MDPLVVAAAELWGVAGTEGQLRLVGGLAVRLLAGRFSRATVDIDLVSLSPSATSHLLAFLSNQGFAVGSSGGWWRALMLEPTRRIIDVSPHPVVNPRTFDEITLRGEPVSVVVGLQTISVACPDDLALLKLAAGRDQDLVDLLVLASAADVDAKCVARSAALDDVERAVARTAMMTRHALGTGELQDVAEELLGRKPEQSELESLKLLLHRLEQEGL